MTDKGRIVPPHVSGGGQVFRRTDPDETVGRAMYRARAEAEARMSIGMARKVKLRPTPDTRRMVETHRDSMRSTGSGLPEGSSK